MHSTASDGTVTPESLMEMAKATGLNAVALTDHDTIGGIARARAVAKKLGIEFIAGCEVAAMQPGGELHLLGLWVPDENESLKAFLGEEQAKRDVRNAMILERLSASGIKLTADILKAYNPGHTIGRPHIARALIKEGYTTSTKEAFEKYLGSRGSAYVPRKLITPEDGVEALTSFGASVFIAHPRLSSTMTANKLESIIQRLKPKGLAGLEVYHSSHDEEDVKLCMAMVEKHNLLASGGSDFHGDAKPNAFLGQVKSNLSIPYSLLEKIKEARLRLGLPLG